MFYPEVTNQKFGCQHNRLLSLPRTLFLKEMSGYGKKIQLPTTIQFDVKFFIFFLLHISRELIDE